MTENAVESALNSIRQHQIARYWQTWQECFRELSPVASRMGQLERTLEAHKKHCRTNPRDEEAFVRLAKIVLKRDDLAPVFKRAKDKFDSENSSYRQRMMELAKVPFSHRMYADVRIVDGQGSVRIEFALDCYILRSNGELQSPYDTE